MVLLLNMMERFVRLLNSSMLNREKAQVVRTKLKDIKSGGVVETTFRPTENSKMHISIEKGYAVFI